MSDGDTTAAPVPQSLVGAVVADRYEVRDLISEGGMGRVYRATQRMLDREVAVKVIHPHLMTSESVVARFQEEAKVASRLRHPGIVEIYDFGRVAPEAGGYFYIAMELLEGTDLAAELEKGPMPLPRVIDILGQVLSALAEAHDQGVTHRDVKPENVILLPRKQGGDRAKLIDFGIAKSSGRRRLTQVGTLVGSPHYMSPEQVKGESAEVSADLYAVGSVLFEALTGQLLFDDEQLVTILQRQMTAPRPDPRHVAPDRAIPARIAEVCQRAIALDPSARYQTAEAFGEALEQARKESLPPPPLVRDSGVRDSLVPLTSSQTPDPSSAGSDVPPVSLRYRVVQRAATLSDLTRLELRASAADSKGDTDKALELHRQGLEQARTLADNGEEELASAAYGTFGRHLAARLLERGDGAEARQILEEVLAWKGLSETARKAALELVSILDGGAGSSPPGGADEDRRSTARPVQGRSQGSSLRPRRPIVEETVVPSKRTRSR